MTQHSAVLALSEPALSSVNMLGMSTTAWLPTLPLTAGFPRGGVLPGAPLNAPFGAGRLAEDIDWGMMNSGSEVTINAFLVTVAVPARTDTHLAEISRTLGRWSALLEDWLALLGDGPTDHILASSVSVRWLDKDIDDTVRWYEYRDAEFHRPHPLSPWQWQHALDHAAAGGELPVARNLLVRAERFAYLGRPREAIVDSATAVEVALTTGVNARLSELGTDPAVSRMLLDRSRMLGGLVDLARKLRLPVPEQIHPHVVAVRNTVMHNGQTVSPAAALAAIRIARQIVDCFEPLDEHCVEPEPITTEDWPDHQ